MESGRIMLPFPCHLCHHTALHTPLLGVRALKEPAALKTFNTTHGFYFVSLLIQEFMLSTKSSEKSGKLGALEFEVTIYKNILDLRLS